MAEVAYPFSNRMRNTSLGSMIFSHAPYWGGVSALTRFFGGRFVTKLAVPHALVFGLINGVIDRVTFNLVKDKLRKGDTFAKVCLVALFGLNFIGSAFIMTIILQKAFSIALLTNMFRLHVITHVVGWALDCLVEKT